MKKLWILILGISLIAGGCTAKTRNPSHEADINNETNQEVKEPSQNEEKGPKEDEERIMVQYNDLITEGKPYEIITFIDKKIAIVSEENGDKMLQGLEKVQKRYQNEYTDSLIEDDLVRQNQLHKIFGYKFDQRKVENIGDEDLKALVVEILKGGYQFITLEGSFYPIIDYGVLRKYTPYVSDEMRAYIKVVSKESDHLTWNGARMNISWNELGNRALEAERYLRKYPEGMMKNEIANLYMMYMDSFMNGSENMPLLDPDTNQLNDKILNSYKDLIANNEGSITAEVIHEYLAVIEKNNFKIDETIMELSNNMHQKIIQKLNLGNGSTDYHAQ
ncbi:MAG: hypothetical protein N4A64_09420 [Marinisporobacter sp.]|jgi:hypothetical protein|nr:hypothetical protein [Marinisporobacter sp.]